MGVGHRTTNCSFYSNNNLIHYGTGEHTTKDEQRSPHVQLYIRPFTPLDYGSSNQLLQEKPSENLVPSNSSCNTSRRRVYLRMSQDILKSWQLGRF